MPPRRLTKRRTAFVLVLAILVAVAGSYAGLRAMSQRANRFRQLVQFHTRRAAMFHKSIGSKGRAARDCEAWGGERMLQVARYYRAEAKVCVKMADYHARLIPKYMYAAAYPWLPVAADPPEPVP